jgi:flagellar hook-basal body complex protein FliE
MDIVKLKPFDFAQAVAKAGLRPEVSQVGKSAARAEGPSFASAIDQALKTVSRSQMDATRMQRELQLDNPTVSLEETMVAMQKAQIGFQATLQVRNRLVQAYNDIMTMQV